MLPASVAPAGRATSTGRASCPSRHYPENGWAPSRPAAFDLNSNPGIRRPRWGGVVEGVAGQIRHPLTFKKRGAGARHLAVQARAGDLAGIDPPPNQLELV